MGYMGLGLQKWIYRQRPRRFFSKDRKPIHSEIDVIQVKKFLPAFSTGHKVEESLAKRDRYSKIKRRKSKIRSLLSLLLFMILLIFIKAQFSLDEYAQDLNSRKKAAHRIDKNTAYRVMTISGRLAYERGDYTNAYEEFMRAEKLYPKAIYHKVYLANMYKKLCVEKGLYCAETEVYTASLRQRYSSNVFLGKLEK